MSSPTYKRLRRETITDPFDKRKKIKVRRWRLLKDLPYFGLQSGAITGYLDDNLSFDADDECWIGKDAIVYGEVTLCDYASILGNAIVRGPDFGNDANLTIEGNARIMGGAIVGYEKFDVHNELFQITGNTLITDYAKVSWPKRLRGSTTIRGNSTTGLDLESDGDVNIYGSARIGRGVTLKGAIHISEYTTLHDNVNIRSDINIRGNSVLHKGYELINGRVINKGTMPPVKKTPEELPLFVGDKIIKASSRPLEESAVMEKVLFIDGTSFDEGVDNSAELSSKKSSLSPERQKWQDRLDLAKKQLDSYESDIVKLIRYPMMTDLTNEHTANMVIALRDIETDSIKNDKEFADAVLSFERTFLVAESNARKIAATKLTDAERKKTADAKNLFAIACNEASSETEKKVSFKQGFARLEGIVSVPEKAIIAMQHRVGLAEIEM